MKYLNKILITVVVMVSSMLSCENKEGGKRWKHCDGFYVGDIIIMEPGQATIKNDTLLINGIANATVERFENRYFADNLMFIKSLKDGSIGRYCEK